MTLVVIPPTKLPTFPFASAKTLARERIDQAAREFGLTADERVLAYVRAGASLGMGGGVDPSPDAAERYDERHVREAVGYALAMALEDRARVKGAARE